MNKRAFSIFISIFLFGLQVSDGIEKSKLKIIDKRTGEKISTPEKKQQIIRVGLRLKKEKTTISCDGPIIVKDLVKGSKKEWAAGKYTVTNKNGNLRFDGKKYSKAILFTPKKKKTYLASEGLRVRGTLKAKAVNTSEVTVINDVNIDSYLNGVLPKEVITSWPMEALKAQAVAARTYLVANLKPYSKNGYDICADIQCQVYGGMKPEHPRTSKAVRETKGEILTYDGKAIKAYFHASNGGATELVKPVWGTGNKPYFKVVKDKFGKGPPWYNWTRELSNKQIMAKLKKKKFVKGTKLKKISIKKKSTSARAEMLSITTDKGTYNVMGNAFRVAIDPWKLRSTLWTNMKKIKNGYRFEGKGWGHGVGMSQWGAKERADAGHSYKKILAFYYPNTELEMWKR